MEEENKNLNNEIKGFDETIEQNGDIDEKLNESRRIPPTKCPRNFATNGQRSPSRKTQRSST